MKYFRLVLLFISIASVANGQIFPQDQNDDDRIDTTKYVNDTITGNDPLFIYYSPRGEWVELGELKALLSGYNKLNFEWYEFDYSIENLGFTKLIFSQDSVAESILQNVNTGGYKVHIFNSNIGIDTNFYCWVNFNQFLVNDISVVSSTCENMKLRSSIEFGEVFIYRDRYDPTIEIEYRNSIESIKWVDDPPSGQTFPAREDPEFNAPTVETKYTITVIDEHGVTRTNSRTIWAGDDDGRGNLHLKAVKADFIGLRAGNEYKDSIIGSAPLSAMFLSKSENADSLEWIFYKHPDWRSSSADSMLYHFKANEINDSLTFTNPPKDKKNSPKGHDIRLIAKGPKYYVNNAESQCISNILKEDFMVVESTFLPKFTNVFSPESATNNLFFFEKESYKSLKSIRSFSIYVYNRWGGRVYFYEGSIDDWKGWDGESYIGGGKVATGVYYYVATVVGYDELPFDDPQITGFIHVFRGE